MNLYLVLIVSACALFVGFVIGANVGYFRGAKDTGRGALEFFDEYLKRKQMKK